MSENNNELPSLKEMALNLSESAQAILKNALTRGAVLAPEEVVKTRWDTCYDCEFFLKEPENSTIPYRCKLCGCGMKLKVRFAATKCPANKWGPV